MITYTWSILEVFGDQTITKVRYLLKAQDETNIVKTEGYHEYSEELVSKLLSEYASQGFHTNAQTNTANYTVPASTNAVTAGPYTIATSTTVTVSTGSRWVVV